VTRFFHVIQTQIGKPSRVIGYVLVQGVAPARVFYAPARDRMALLMEME
jgi:hypothetical protein